MYTTVKYKEILKERQLNLWKTMNLNDMAYFNDLLRFRSIKLWNFRRKKCGSFKCVETEENRDDAHRWSSSYYLSVYAVIVARSFRQSSRAGWDVGVAVMSCFLHVSFTSSIHFFPLIVALRTAWNKNVLVFLRNRSSGSQFVVRGGQTVLQSRIIVYPEINYFVHL